MRIVITSGPSFAPLDQVRRLSNFSTGELGTLLAEGFAGAGHKVTCFRGSASTFSSPLWGVEVIPFDTNEDLEKNLSALPGREEVNFIFHAAALCDFVVREIKDEQGQPVTLDKVSTRKGALQVTLDPALKVIARLRRMFPSTIITGWKYELDGTTQETMAKGHAQIDECLTDACVVNGRAYGAGYGVISRGGEKAHLPDKAALCRFLIEWAEHMPTIGSTPRQDSFHALSSFVPLAPFI